MTAVPAAAVKHDSNIGVLQAGAALSLFMAALMGFVAVFLWTLPRDVAPIWSSPLCAGMILAFLALALLSFQGARFWMRQLAHIAPGSRGSLSAMACGIGWWSASTASSSATRSQPRIPASMPASLVPSKGYLSRSAHPFMGVGLLARHARHTHA